MGMMTRRNIKKRAVVKTAPLNTKVEETTTTEATSDIQYTKTEISRMSTADLKKLAKENGLDESMSGAEIKKALIDKFNL